MILPSRIPPPELWPRIEKEIRRSGCCTASALPNRLFCGEMAVGMTEQGPRCAEHMRETDQPR